VQKRKFDDEKPILNSLHQRRSPGDAGAIGRKRERESIENGSSIRRSKNMHRQKLGPKNLISPEKTAPPLNHAKKDPEFPRVRG
jgi:hypothetical protein